MADYTLTPEEEAYRKAIEQAGAGYSTALGVAGQRQADAMRSIADQYGKSMDQVIADTQASNAAAEKDFADVALEQRRALDEARQEDARLAQQERSRAVWAGATEAASAIANLVGVGSFGASNQVYRQYSKDWMDRADQERRLRRSRIDNLGDRQRQLQQQLASLRQGNANTVNNMRINQAGQQASMAEKQAAQQADNVGKVAQAGFQTAMQAAQAGYQAYQQGRAFEEQRRARQAQEAENRRYHDAQTEASMARSGYTKGPDGKWTYTGKPTASGSGSGANSFVYDARIDGQNVRLVTNKNTFEQAKKDGVPEIKDDLAKIILGDGATWEDVNELLSGAPTKEKKRNKYAADNKTYANAMKYENVIKALNGDASMDSSTIDSFIDEHRTELNNFNKHVQRVAQNGAVSGDALQQQAEEEDQTGLGGYN